MANKFSFNNLISSISKMISEEDASAKASKKSSSQKAHDDEIQNAILVLAAAVIRCNRNYTGETEMFISDFLIKQFGPSGVKHRMAYIAEHLDVGTESLIRISCKEIKMLTTHDSRLSIIEFLFGVAAVDDFVNAKEIKCIHGIAGYIGITDKDFKELRHNFMSENNPYKILGIDEEATREQIRAAYRKMVLKYHPDKREANTTEAEASVKFRQIQRAFEIISGN